MPLLGGVSLIFVIFFIVLGVLWVLMPFAIFGTKDLLQDLIVEQKRTNTLLQRMVATDEKKQ